jgi:hypothetical protein
MSTNDDCSCNPATAAPGLQTFKLPPMSTMTTGESASASVTTTVVQAAAIEPLASAFPVPAYPPSSWFTERPDWLDPDTKIAVDDAGRVAGYFYNAGQCLVHDAAACPKPSPTFYAAFHQQQVAVDEGTLVRCGVIGNVNGHANPYAPVDTASAHYADPDRQLISCCAYDDEHGGFILGAMVPHATYGDVALVRRSALSGDWRPMPPAWWAAHGIQGAVIRECEGFDCIGPTLVTRPGLPLVRRFDYGNRAASIIGGNGGVQLDEQERPMTTRPTVIDLGNGVTITTTTPEAWGAEPGPHPVEEAMTAASPVPPGNKQAPPGAKQPSSSAPPAATDNAPDLSARVDALEQDVAQLKDVVGQLIDAVSQPMQSAAELPPERDPKA